MSETDLSNDLNFIFSTYTQMAQTELSERWKEWTLDLSRREMHEVIGGLLARQVTLASHLIAAPAIWNDHIAPLILRSMVDNHINLAWIFCDPLDRSRKFILHGLGQEKLQIEHLKAKLETENPNNDQDPLAQIVKQREEWLNAQRYTFLTVVNIGSWSGTDTRKMAEEAGCLDLYNYAYTSFSAVTHNMWNHISKFNLVSCHNPLHRHHRIPIATFDLSNLDFPCMAAEYVETTFSLFDEKTSVKVAAPSALSWLVQELNQIHDANR
jgi:Family of unknown function (DUF5677)